MRDIRIEKSISRSLRLQLTSALAIIAVLVGGVGGIAAYAEISGAIIGSGTVIVEGRSRHVQHRDGGTIELISVHEGERVEAGEVLFRLDDTLVQANLWIVTSQVQQLLAQEARLLAEQGRLATVVFPEELIGADKRLELLRRGQEELMTARRATLAGRKSQLVEQIRQFNEKISALTSEQQAVAENIELIAEQIEDVALLHRKGLMVDSQLMTIKRERATLMGSLAALRSEIVEAQQAIGERELQKIQLDEVFLEEVLTDLDAKRVEIARLSQERLAATDRLNRLDVRSPLGGFVHHLGVHTISQVITPGETLLEIIPEDDDLIVEAKLSPTDIDQVRSGQTARVRLTGLDQRVTPELHGSVLDISPDLTTDEKTGMTYYTTRIALPEEEMALLKNQALRPGMPVEVFVETNMRSVLSYLAKPLQDQIQHAMREN